MNPQNCNNTPPRRGEDLRAKHSEYVARTSRELGIEFGDPKVAGYRQPFHIPDKTMIGYHQPSVDAREIMSAQGPLMIAGTLSPHQEVRFISILSKNLVLFAWAGQKDQVSRPRTS